MLKALLKKVIKMLKDRLKHGIMEYSYSSYYNPWFLIVKKEKDYYKLVVIVININQVII